MDRTVPHNGPLSGMIITAATAALTLSGILFFPDVYARFDAPIGAELSMLFLLSAAVMGVHKLDSFLAREYDYCPVYHTQGNAWGSEPRRAIFMTFVTTFLGMLFVIGLALVGPPWHLAILAIWISHGLHELHHAAKSVSRRRVYPGLYTSFAFVALQWGMIYPRWFDIVVGEQGSAFALSYLLLPAVFVAFVLEDRRWIALVPRAAWDPRAADPQMALDDGSGAARVS